MDRRAMKEPQTNGGRVMRDQPQLKQVK